MLSLRDKLKAAAPRNTEPQKARTQDCLVQEYCVPLSSFALDERIGGDSLTLIRGEPLPEVCREEILFLDTETTGLSHGAGTVAFLVGVGFFTEKSFTVRQYLMRDYDEEIFLLQHVAQEIENRKMICTFNGATFDLPLLEARFILNRMRTILPARPHLDLLPASRRVWKLRLQKCNLSSLEAAVLGAERQDDLPGALVPERYFKYLESGDFSLLSDVLRHNGQDIISLAHILDKLIRLHDHPLEEAWEAEDLYSLGRILEKRGKAEGARMCYRAADRGTVSVLARGKMAESLRRAGEWDEAENIYRQMARDKQGGVMPLIALAKIREHKKRDIPAAIEYTQQAIRLAADRDDKEMLSLQRRFARLMNKARRK